MSKEIREIYKCDCCKQEVLSADDLVEVVLPYQVAKDTTGSFISWEMIDKYVSSKKFEVCQECAKRIVEGYRIKNIELGCFPYSGWTFEILGETVNKKIDMLDGIKNAKLLKSISGRDLGEKQRKKFDLDLEDNSEEPIDVMIGEQLLFMSSSFFLGMFGKSVRKCGSRERFRNKYIFKANKLLESNIEDGIREALKLKETL